MVTKVERRKWGGKRIKHFCQWELHPNQTDTGLVGVRLYCTVKFHSLTVHKDLVEKYLANDPVGNLEGQNGGYDER